MLFPVFSFAQNDSVQTDKNEILINSKKPLYFIDGKQTNEAVINELDPNTIESINVLKGEKAIEKYGESGKNGVIEINMKKREVSFLDKLENSIPRIGINSNKTPEIIPIDSLQISPKKKFQGTVCQGSIRNNSNPKIVVDGEFEMPIDYDSQTYYGLDFEYKLFMFFKFMEDKHKISFI